MIESIAHPLVQKTSLTPTRTEAAQQPHAVPDTVDVETLKLLRNARAMLLGASRQAGAVAVFIDKLPDGRLDDTAATHLAMLRQSSDLGLHDARRSLDQLGQFLGLEPGEGPSDPSAMDASGLVWGSHADFYAQIMQLLGVLQNEWLAKYQDAMSTFLEFYTEFSDAMEMLKPEGSGDKGDVKVDFGQVHRKLQELLNRYGLPENALASFKTQAEADAFIASIGLPGLKVSSAGGEFVVKMDLTAVQQLKDSMANGGTVTWDSARYNAWVSSRDSNMEQIKHVSKVLGEKLSEMTQKFDNIVKILSSTVDKITEADMSFVNGL